MDIVICDDEAQYADQLSSFIKEYASKNVEHDIRCAVFLCPYDLLEAVDSHQVFNVAFLDIVMKGMDGIRLGEQMRKRGWDGKIVYLTSSSEFALDAFRVRALDYLLKPLDKAKIWQTLDRISAELDAQEDRVVIVRTKDATRKLYLKDIEYAELIRRNVIYHMVDGSEVVTISIRTSFGEAVKELAADRRFVFCGTSLSLNMDRITMVDKGSVRLNSGKVCYLAKKACMELRSAWYDHYFDKEGAL